MRDPLLELRALPLQARVQIRVSQPDGARELMAGSRDRGDRIQVRYRSG